MGVVTVTTVIEEEDDDVGLAVASRAFELISRCVAGEKHRGDREYEQAI